jgi:hypothetical protein
MEIRQHHGSVEITTLPGRGLRALCCVGLLASLAGAVAAGLLLRPGWVPLPLALVGVFSALRARMGRPETLAIGLFQQTGREGDHLGIRSTELQGIAIDDAPQPPGAAWLAHLLGIGAGRLRLKTSQGDFHFGRGLSNGELSALAARLHQLGYAPLYSTLARSRKSMS